MGNILTGGAITAGGCPDKNAVFIQQTHGHAIEFRFATKRQSTQSKLIGVALLKRLKVTAAKGIIQAQHR